MKHWSDVYPHKLYASVLLLDNKIEDWKVVNYAWIDLGNVSTYWKLDRLNDYEIRSTSWEVNNDEEHHRVFVELAPEWFRQWSLADDFKGGKPYDKEKINGLPF